MYITERERAKLLIATLDALDVPDAPVTSEQAQRSAYCHAIARIRSDHLYEASRLARAIEWHLEDCPEWDGCSSVGFSSANLREIAPRDVFVNAMGLIGAAQNMGRAGEDFVRREYRDGKVNPVRLPADLLRVFERCPE